MPAKRDEELIRKLEELGKQLTMESPNMLPGNVRLWVHLIANVGVSVIFAGILLWEVAPAIKEQTVEFNKSMKELTNALHAFNRSQWALYSSLEEHRYETDPLRKRQPPFEERQR